MEPAQCVSCQQPTAIGTGSSDPVTLKGIQQGQTLDRWVDYEIVWFFRKISCKFFTIFAPPVSIQSPDIEMVDNFNYLGGCSLDWKH